MKINAIDISGNNTITDFSALRKAGISAAFVKSTQGLAVSSAWERYLDGAIKAGMDCGTYTYVVAENLPEARAHANKLIEVLDKQKGRLTLPVAVDMEDVRYYDDTKFDKEKRTKILLTFAEAVDKAGYYPIVYINPAWLEQWVDKSQIVGRYDIWLAAWTNSPDSPTKYKYGQTVWQWGAKMMSGATNLVDGDIIYVDYPAKIRAAGKNYLPPKPQKVCTLFYSYGSAAMRKEPRKGAEMIKRCEKGKLYPIAETCLNEGVLWLRHADTGTWSMERDGAVLFCADKPYTVYHTTARLNVRSGAGKTYDVVGTLENGAEIYVTEYGKEWSRFCYNGVMRYVTSKYIK